MARATAKGRLPISKRDYLFKRPGSQFWRVRLQCDGRSTERSLKTTDRLEAELAAHKFIAEHKARLLARRPKLVTSFLHKLAPGQEHAGPDGGRIIATDADLIYISADGKIERQESNRIPTTELVNLPQPRTAKEAIDLLLRMPKIAETLERPTLPQKNGDDALFENYLKRKEVTGYCEREARAVWAMFKQRTEGKTLKDCTRDDGHKLADHYREQGLKPDSVRKKVNWLCAAVNLAIKDGKLTFNPFSGVAPYPKKGEKLRRMPLDDADMAAALANLGNLGDTDALLFRLLAATGMRLGEAFEIEAEQIEKGCRFVIVGTKTEQSERRVPLPASVLPHLPETITGRLFNGTTNDASKRLNAFLDGCGITDPAKVVHSLRHRAQDQLRAAGCPEDIREALLGHEQKTVAKGYGAGFPVTVLRKWIDEVLPLTKPSRRAA